MNTLTLSQLAQARGLDPEFLHELGWQQLPEGIAIPWPTTATGGPPALHIRRLLERTDGPDGRWTWRAYHRDTLLPYGANLVTQMVEQAPNRIVIVESEADAVAIWAAHIPALATGGADAWQSRWWPLLQGFEQAVVWLEDAGTLPLLRALVSTRPADAPPLYVCHALGQAQKDAGRIAALHNGSGGAIVTQVVSQAVPVRVVPDLLEAVVDALQARHSGQNYEVRCPFHEDRSPSLSIFRGDAGAWAWRCHAGSCGAKGPLALLGAALGLVASPEDRAARGKDSAQLVSAHIRDESWAETNLRVHTAKEIAAETPTAVPWLVPPYVAAGAITEMDGKIKAAGKTTFVLHLCRAVLDGVCFLGRPTKQTKVLYLSEQPPTSFRQALADAALLGRADFFVVYSTEHLAVPWPDLARAAVAEAQARGAGLLVVDTLGQFAKIRGDQENNSGAALEAMEPLQEAAAKGLGVVITRHERKSGGDVADAARGSSAFAGAVDVILALRRPTGGQDRPTSRVLHALSRFHETPDTLVIDKGPDGYRAIGSQETIGWHLYLAHPGGHVPNTAGKLGPGLDIRGDGGYAVSPPSLHRSGHFYTWGTLKWE
ncbi:MAG: AAA family ATPase [Chloroflexi bacterium]|nr:AAA family ATPase [Chloroflexota bacterium]